MDKRGKVPKSPPRGRHSPGAAALSGYIPAAIDAAGEDINPFRASSRPASKGALVLASVAATIADWLEPVTSRLVYAGRVASVASLGVGDVLRRRLGTALVIAGAVISLGVGIVLGGAGSSVSASLPGVQNSSTHSTTAKDWGELRTGISTGTTGSSSGKSQAPNAPAAAGSVVGGGSSLVAGPNTAGPLTSGTNSSSSGSHAQSPAASTPASTGGSPSPTTPSGGSSGPGSGTKPTTTSTTSGGSPTTTRPTTTTTKPPTTTTTTQPPPPPTTTTQPPPPTTTTVACSPLQHFLNQC
jgi:hypothetical protein